jgi:RecJ-like exonuclease
MAKPQTPEQFANFCKAAKENNAKRFEQMRNSTNVCDRCNGQGTINCYSFNQGGRCFKCGGSGKA